MKDLRKWYREIVTKLDQISDNILVDMTTTFNEVHYFASLADRLLIEQENQLKKARSHQDMNIIEERINQIIFEIELLQSLSFHLNCDSVKLIGKLQINFNNNDIKLNDPLIPVSSYRFLISRNDAIKLNELSLSFCHLTSLHNESISECVLTFIVFDFDSFLNTFKTYWNLFTKTNQIRLLMCPTQISFILEQSNETLNYLEDSFQLNQIKIFPDFCPKSDEKILLINGKQHDLIIDCIEEIYYNIEEKNNRKQNIKLYNPSHLSTKDMDDIINKNLDYGGFIQNQIRTNYSRANLFEHTESSDDDDDDDLWNENDEWWHYSSNGNMSSEVIQREINVNNIQAGVNALRIDRIKQKTGAYVYINGANQDLKRTVFIKGTREQVDRAYACIDTLLDRHKNGKLPMKQRCSHDKSKEK
ncbi:unnamed protein product [Adineta steineri]|uniref:K Homology domain-containing protein n=1 Tax=Adineta steineri TaxID=433720 RepID=A0A818NTV9_9BILA|nr:unnamed protein product [Adineta steineri]